jgi:hypothetical protein
MCISILKRKKVYMKYNVLTDIVDDRDDDDDDDDVFVLDLRFSQQ